MRHLSKVQEKERQDHLGNIEDKITGLDAAITAYNDVMAAERFKVDKALADLNAVIAEVDEWRDAINIEQQDYFDNKSERWQEGEIGILYNQWKEEWEQELQQVELDLPEDLSMPDVEAKDDLENLTEYP